MKELEMVTEPSVWKWAGETLYHYWKNMLFISIASAIMAMAGFLLPLIWSQLLDSAVGGVMNYWMVFWLLVILFVQTIPAIHLFRARFINHYRFDMKNRLFKHLLRLSIPFYKDTESTRLVLEAGKGIDASTRLMNFGLRGNLLTGIPIAIASFVYIAIKAPEPFLILTILGVFFVFFLFLNMHFGSRISAVEEEWQELDDDVGTRYREVLHLIETVKTHTAESNEAAWYRDENLKIKILRNKQNVFGAWFSVMCDLSHFLPFVISLVIFLPYVAKGELTIGSLVALQLYCARAVAPAGFVGDIYQEIVANATKLKPTLRTLIQQPTVSEVESPVAMQPLRHEIQLSNVSFRYEDDGDFVLKDISLIITAGERVAVVGPTGSGKTTLAKLLVRFYDPNHGLITMDGTDLRQISFETLYRQTSFVMQEVPIFSGTIGENVGYGLECADEQLRVACASASADFVLTKTDGLDTKIGELGTKLSGGEQQRLALARVFLRKPSLLILDEATSRLDETTQREVQQAFMGLNGGTTIVAIAHRITTVMHADRIIVMDDGRIVDAGSHDELLTRCDLYKDLCREMQA